MQGKRVQFSPFGKFGRVTLVYTEAVASGTKDYTPYTMLLVADSNGDIYHIYPRDIIKVEVPGVQWPVPEVVEPVHLPNTPYDPKRDTIESSTDHYYTKTH